MHSFKYLNYTTDSNSAFVSETHARELGVIYFLGQSQSHYFRNYFLSNLGSRDLLLGCWPLIAKYQLFSHEESKTPDVV